MNKNWFTRFKQNHVDEQYLVNMRAATEYFQTWFQTPHGGYAEMLIWMHRLATSGGYSGHTPRCGPMVPAISEFRGGNSDWFPLLKPGWFTDVQVNADGTIYPTLCAGSLRRSHHLIVREHGYELHLPHEDMVPEFVSRMASIMETLRSVFSAKYMAEYIQCFVVGHVFNRVNYSVCMAQVNAILYHYGYKPQRHGWFDFDCLVYDFDRIESKFETKLER